MVAEQHPTPAALAPPQAAPAPSPSPVPTKRVITRPALALAHFSEFLFSQPVSAYASVFQLKHPPPVPIVDFVLRLESFVGCSPQTYVVAAWYLRRVFACHRHAFNPQTVHKMVLASIVVGAKFCDDVTSSQSYYARCGGIDVAELNALERAFLGLLGYNAFVSDDDFVTACELLLTVQSALVVPAHTSFG